MTIKRIICLPDLLRGVSAFSNGFFDLVREPIRQACNIKISHSPDEKKPHGLVETFDLQFFRQLAGTDNTPSGQAWQASYFELPDAALAYLKAHLPDEGLILGFEMPPWLLRACETWQRHYLDIGVSPLRFARDLYVTLRTNHPMLGKRIQPHQVSKEELQLEASQLAAFVRIHSQLLHDRNRPVPDLEEGGLLLIGQAPYDASLLAPHKRGPLTWLDYADKVRTLAAGRTLFYKPHPFATEYAEQETAQLEELTGQPVKRCLQNAYQILSSDADITLAGISSGLLQEAAWFGKTAHTFYQPYIEVSFTKTAGERAFQQIHFQTLLSPGFWHQVLAPSKPAPKLSHLPLLPHHHARLMLDQWWDYSKVLTWEKNMPSEWFWRAGGASLRARIDQIEASMMAGSSLTPTPEG